MTNITIQPLASIDPAYVAKGVGECGNPKCRGDGWVYGANPLAPFVRSKCPTCHGHGSLRYFDLTKRPLEPPAMGNGRTYVGLAAGHYESSIRAFLQVYEIDPSNKSCRFLAESLDAIAAALRDGYAVVLLCNGTELGERCAGVVRQIVMERIEDE